MQWLSPTLTFMITHAGCSSVSVTAFRSTAQMHNVRSHHVREHPARCSNSVLAVLYCIAGCQLYWFSPINTVETLDQYNIITGVGFGGGSICFFTGATLLLARQVRRLSELHPCRLFHVIYLSDTSPKLTSKPPANVSSMCNIWKAC